MNDRANNEKLRILQERLAQIKQKDETLMSPIDQREEVIEVALPQTETPQKEKTPISFGWLKYVIIIGALGYGSFYAYNNMDFSNIFSSSDKGMEETQKFVLEYNLNIPGEKIAITASFEDESSAKAMVNDLKVKGYKCDYFFLPNKSNSKEEIYKVFIGPYENAEETNQWTQNLERDFEIVQL
tara:strand:- start:79 stop:630 length:552 start_codon:yes stop_codon:yes gene_type:complete